MAKQPARKGPVNRPQVVRRNAVTAGEAKDYESRSLSRSRGAPSQPQGRGTLTRGETGDATSKSLRRAQNAKAGRSSATMTPSERGGFETKSLKQARTNPKAGNAARTAAPKGGVYGPPPSGKPPAVMASASPSGGSVAKRGGSSVVPKMGATPRVEKVVSGSHEMVRPNALPGAAKVGGMAKFMSKIPIIGAIVGAAVGGNAVKDLPGPMKVRTDLANWYAGKTGSEANADRANAPTKYTVKPRETVVAPAGQVPGVPSKTIPSATPQGSSPPPMKKAPAPSQKATGTSKSPGRAMRGAELADFLGLSGSSKVRANLVNAAKKK